MRSIRTLPVCLALVHGAELAGARAATIQVTIEGLDYTPAQVDARAGDTIEWVNKDVLVHTVTVRGGWEVLTPPRKSASRVVREAGTIDYYCRFHPNMKGRINVLP
jgi:plastocyanin